MAKTTRRHIEKGRCEQREYKIISRIISKGRVRFIVTCPFCEKNKEFLAQVELGKGIRCKCGAMFYQRKCYFYHYHNKDIATKKPDVVHYISVKVRCPKRSWAAVGIHNCHECGYKQNINLETGIVECRHGRKKPGE
jgi:acetone carboxylase gamma subunit